MPIPVKKINLFALAVGLPLSVLVVSATCAQAGPTTLNNAPGAPASATPPASTPPPTDAQVLSNSIFHENAEEGTTGKTGADVMSTLADRLKATDILGTPAIDSAANLQFKTYISLPAVPDDRIKAYMGQMQQVTDLLKTGSSTDMFTAWKTLYAMGDYSDLDAGISRELAHRIEAIWNSDRTQNGLEVANTKLRNKLDTDIHNADLDADDLHAQDLEEKAKGGGGRGGGSQSNSNATNSALLSPNADPVAAEASMLPQMSGALQRKMTLTDDYLKTLESRAEIKLNEIKEHKMNADEQADFETYIKMLYDSHYYDQVIIAADFYRALFNQGDYPVDMQSEVSKSLEINREVSQGVEVFKYEDSKGQIYGAASELRAAFATDEYHPALQGLPREEKEQVGTLLDKLDVLKNEIEVRDFEKIDSQIADIKKVANDFDDTKPEALVNGIKLSSRLRLGKAKLLAQQGELNDAMKEFQTAAEEWPGNPDLITTSNKFFGTEDVVNQSTTEFDNLVADQNYRQIFDKQIQFATAVHGDTKREQQLKDALVKVQKAEIASEKANMMVINGDADGAWETIEEATKDWPDDVKLNRLLASYSARSADFVSAINKAREAEGRKEYGYSLTWYVNAQSYYPASTIALAGIDNVSKLILAAPEQKTASLQN
jgi:hypothetical protein